MLDKVTDNTAYKAKALAIQEKCNIIQLKIEKLIAVNAKTVLAQEDYHKEYTELVEQYENLQVELINVNLEISKCAEKRVVINGFIAELKKHDIPLQKFDELVWQAVIQHMRIYKGGDVVFVFRDGTEFAWKIDRVVEKRKG